MGHGYEAYSSCMMSATAEVFDIIVMDLCRWNDVAECWSEMDRLGTLLVGVNIEYAVTVYCNGD